MSRLKVLDFDIENRPLSYWTPDRPSAEVTAIAWKFIGSRRPVQVALLGDHTVEQILDQFVSVYDEADMVTGHYIRRHDLPIINGALLELGLKPLTQKLTSDTKLDLMKKGDLPTSQEALADFLGVNHRKIHMTQADWREANRLTPAGLEKTRRRVVGDVKQHIEMRRRLLELGYLKGPRLWVP